MAPKFTIYVECGIEHQGKFLVIKRPLGKHGEGMLAFPGGSFELSDCDAEDVLIYAAKREVFEEVGLELIDPIQYITSTSFVETKNQLQVMGVIFLCKLEKTKLDLKISQREVEAYYWLSRDEIIMQENCPEWMKRYLGLMH